MNPSENQFNVHRGLKLHSGNNFKINTKNLGMHWSSDSAIAEQAGGIRHMPEAVRVIHAKVSKSSVETNPAVLKERSVNSPTHFEKEVPVKENAPVNVTGITKFRQKESGGAVKSRTRTYNPPREMKA